LRYNPDFEERLRREQYKGDWSLTYFPTSQQRHNYEEKENNRKQQETVKSNKK